MSATTFFFIVAACWLAIGALTSLIMARRGHDLFQWAILGAVFGPLVAVLALGATRQRHRPAHAVLPGVRGSGPIDVLVGLDGSQEAYAAIEHALKVLDGRIGRLTLATVLSPDASEKDDHRDIEVAEALARARIRHSLGERADGVVLTGEPAAELERYAGEGGYHVPR